MTVDEDVARVWRQFATRLATALVLGAVTFAGAVVYFLAVQRSQGDELQHLRSEVSVTDRQVECRSRITAAAEQVRAERDSVGWQALVDRLVVGSPAGLEDRGRRVAELNRRLDEATERRARAVEICAANPDYTPPS